MGDLGVVPDGDRARAFTLPWTPSHRPGRWIATAQLVALAVARRNLSSTLRMAGATYEIVVLSSSPPEPRAASPHNVPPRRRVAMPPPSLLASSPPLNPIRTASGASTLVSRVAAIPEGAVRGFATVGSLVQSKYFAHQPVETRPAQSRRGPREGSIVDVMATKKPRKRATKKSTADGDEIPIPKPRERKPSISKASLVGDPELRLPIPTKSPFFDNDSIKSTNATSAVPAPELTKAGKPTKPRAKKPKAVHEGAETVEKAVAKLGRPRITKAKRGTTGGTTDGRSASVVSAHLHGSTEKDAVAAHHLQIQEPVDTHIVGSQAAVWEIPQSPRPNKRVPPKQRPLDLAVEGLGLGEAVRRRRDWTPPRDTSIQSPFTDSVGKENAQRDTDLNGNFTHMLTTFAYAQPPPLQTTASTNTSTAKAMAVTKRRRVEVGFQAPITLLEAC